MMRSVIMSLVLVGGLVWLSACTLVSGNPNTATTAGIPFRGPFAVFDLCIDGTPAEKVSYLQSIGYSGMGLGGINLETDPNLLKSYADLPAVKNGSFRIYSALWWYEIKTDVGTSANLAKLDALLAQAKRMGMALWPVADWTSGEWPSLSAGQDRAVAQLTIIAQHCRAAGVQLVLYPHVGCVFETAEQALAIQQRIAANGCPEVKISIHLCHELKRNNRDRIAEIVKKVTPHLGLATISGANNDTYTNSTGDYWSTAIMPLDRGSYDGRLFVQALTDANYAGPLELHTYALPQTGLATYDRHLERSLAVWKSWVR